jgi:hypothetical protein
MASRPRTRRGEAASAAAVALLAVAAMLVAFPGPLGGSPARGSHGPGADRPSAVGRAGASAAYWTNLSLTAKEQPPPANDGNFVWDSTAGDGVLFGGEFENATLARTTYANYTWTFLHGHWTNVSTTVAPSERWGTVMSDDPAEGGVILFGGAEALPHQTVYLNDTWLWSGGTWRNITPVHSPPGTYWASMAYDSALGELVLFGGGNQSSQYTNETWTFSHGAWTEIFPSTEPPARDAQMMVDDAASSEIVMFGGGGLTGDLNDTWTFSGGDWAPIGGGNHPGARVGAGLAYDNLSDQVELYGGSPAPFDYYATWFFSAGQWTETNLSNPPPNPTNPWQRMTFDPVDNYTVFFYTPEAQAYSATWTLTVPPSVPPPPPGRIYVLLGAKPSTITLGQSTSFVTVVTPYASNDTYVYSSVPLGCTGTNASTFLCTPSQVGHYVVGVNVSATNHSHGAATTTLDVTQNTTTPPPSGGGSVSSWWWIVVIVVVIAAIVIGVALRRRRKSPPPPPAFSPPPPPEPPPAPPPT